MVLSKVSAFQIVYGGFFCLHRVYYWTFTLKNIHISPGVLWEGTGQNSLFRDHHCHHSPEQFQLTEKDKKLEGVGWKKTLAKIYCYPLYVEIKKKIGLLLFFLDGMLVHL